MKTLAVRLRDGQDVVSEIKRIVEEHRVDAGVILSGVGSLKTSSIRVPVIDGEVKYIHPQNLEI
ncbi:MAG: DUF296 domain-containing protein, partial [Thaumarchaeota archaeon]|nr:DUF296 domain-containing protein [Nitrososphaerota archaeon]